MYERLEGTLYIVLFAFRFVFPFYNRVMQFKLSRQPALIGSLYLTGSLLPFGIRVALLNSVEANKYEDDVRLRKLCRRSTCCVTGLHTLGQAASPAFAEL